MEARFLVKILANLEDTEYGLLWINVATYFVFDLLSPLFCVMGSCHRGYLKVFLGILFLSRSKENEWANQVLIFAIFGFESWGGMFAFLLVCYPLYMFYLIMAITYISGLGILGIFKG